jgi:hypothetical protein
MSNDALNRRDIPIPIRAKVGNVITVTPSPLSLGLLSQGEESPLKNVVVRGTQPFHITKIECPNPAVEIFPVIDPNAPPKLVHPLTIKYRNPMTGEGAPKDGMMQARVRVTTDIPGIEPTFYVTMSVLEKKPGEEVMLPP